MTFLKTFRHFGILAVALVAGALLAFSSATLAQDKPGSEVVAKIGDKELTIVELDMAAAQFGEELAQVPELQRRAILIDVLIDMEILAAAAREKELDQSPEFAERLEFIRTQALRDAYVQAEIVGGVSDEDVANEYNSQIGNFEAEEELRASHILVESEEEAIAIIEELDNGADFADLAREKSTGPSGPNGGDLGYFGRGRMVPAFEEAVFALDVGAHTTAPVQSQFGWHVITLVDRRETEPPALAEIEDEVRTALVRQRFETVMQELRESANVEIMPLATDTDADADDAEPKPEGNN